MAFFAVLFIAHSLMVLSSGFKITDRFPSVSNNDKLGHLVVQSRSSVTLTCTSSQKFLSCSWAHPSGQSCGIFTNDGKKDCPTTQQGKQLSSWTVSSQGDRTCIVEISAVSETEVGNWNCELDGTQNSDQAITNLKLLQPPTVILHGPSVLRVQADTKHSFTCVADGGTPSPTNLKWTLDKTAVTIINQIDDKRDGHVQEDISVDLTQNWDGRKLKCTAEQKDDLGNVVHTTDERNVKVVEARAGHKFQGAKAGQFRIVDRHPQANSGQAPEMILAEGVSVTFSCTSSTPWGMCQWKHPNSQDACGLFFNDQLGRACRIFWPNFPSSGEWTVKAKSQTECIIQGTNVLPSDTGEWNCELRSKPIIEEHNTYESGQEFFKVNLLQPVKLNSAGFPQNTDLVDGETIVFTVQITGPADPPPKLIWTLNERPVNLELVEDTPTRQTVRYTAKQSDSGYRLECTSLQTDSDGNTVKGKLSTLLAIKARPPLPPDQSDGFAGIIAIIVSVGVFILLALILILVAWRTGRWCFRQPVQVVHVVQDAERAPQGTAGVQTVTDGGNSVAVGADFGPAKPSRDKREECQPLLGREASELIINDNLEALLDDDEIRQWTTEEPTMSRATSLSSINTEVSEKDWVEAFRSFGPKFADLADMAAGQYGDDEDEDVTSSQSTTGQSEDVPLDSAGGSEV